MSIEFIKLVPQLINERYSMQVQFVINRKISCGLFYGFSLPANEDIGKTAAELKNVGFITPTTKNPKNVIK